jgi:ABC-2 type transport system ATP-binding protein
MVHAVVVRNAYKKFGELDAALWKQIHKSDSAVKKSVKAALDHVSFEVDEGEIFGLLGPEGSGKSTLMRLIATLLLPDKGDIKVFGYSAVQQPLEVKGLVNMVSEGASFFKKLSPMENLLYGASLYGMNGKDTHIRIEECLLCVGLEDHEIYKPMGEMSRGMQGIVAIARALLSRPRLLLMDEPTKGLDVHSKREVQGVIKDLNRQYGLTILLATQDKVEADNLCDRTAIIERGKIVALDTSHGFRQNISPHEYEPTREMFTT